jgi:hypothetical protein
MLLELHETVAEAIDEAYELMASKYYTDYILFIGRGDVIPGINRYNDTDYVVDYNLDTLYDKSRTEFYLHYLNRNYRKDGFCYEGEQGIDDLHIELMIYCHLWDSSYFIKSMCRMASIVSGNGYLWNIEIPWRKKDKFMNDRIIELLKRCGLKIGELVESCYDSSVRNAFAHSLYTIDAVHRIISFRPQTGFKSLSFDEFQTIFLKSVFLMNLMENALETNHNKAASLDSVLTEPFMTPDNVQVQVRGRIIQRGDKACPVFRIIKVK